MTTLRSAPPSLNGRHAGGREGERLPPHDIGAEEAVLAALLLDADAAATVRPLLEPTDFFREQNRWCYEACLSVADRGEEITLTTVAHELGRAGRLDDVGGEPFLVELANKYFTAIGVEAHARIVSDKARRRDLIEAAQELVRSAFTDVGLEEAIELVAGAASKVSEERATHLAVVREMRRLRVQDIARRRFAREQLGTAIAPTFQTLDERLATTPKVAEPRIHGWQPAGTRVVLAAQYKSGKTTVVDNVVRSLVDGNRLFGVAQVRRVVGTVVVVDTEMGEGQLDAWLRDLGIEHVNKVVVVALRGNVGSLDLLDPDRLAEWAQRLRDVQCEYLVLDCLRPVLDALALDENRDAGRFLTAFDNLLKTAGIADALVVHHMGHTSERARGDSRIRD